MTTCDALSGRTDADMYCGLDRGHDGSHGAWYEEELG